ncbi:MAG: 3-dehydroquinate synthase [Acidimicrobiia bacterium]|nr:MAG: 3-dehydroquinate synthase [Acidimicrobiia bacterium]
MRRHVIWRGDEPVSTVLVGRGVSSVLAELAGSRPRRRVAVLCQPSTVALAQRYANDLHAAGFEVTGYTLPDGEEAKQLGVVEDVYRFLNASHFARDDLVVGIGGGALTDVTGFVAGTYLRGVPAIYIATTLLAAVDASIGGKTAVNVDGKNLVGVFAHPEAVIVDIDVIDALPRSQKIIGAAEAIKTGFIADTEIITAFEESGIDTDLENIVNRSVAVKASVVNEDFTERGARTILNYGHTIGHAIESTTGRPHGEAVAVGMVAAGHAAAHLLGFDGVARQEAVLERIGLPLRAPEAKREAVRAMMALDKKRDDAGLRMVLLEDFGAPTVVHPDDATVQAAFDGIDLT